MMNWGKYRFIILFFTCLIGCIIGYIFWGIILSGIKWIFNIKYLNFWAGLIALILSLLVRIKEKKISLNRHIAFDDFKNFIEEVSSYFTGGSITLICSISLAKGLFFHFHGIDVYFNNFKDWELIFISVITLYLLFISIREVVRDFIKLWPDKKEYTPQPIDKPQKN